MVRGDLVALGGPGFPDCRARMPERDRRHRPDPIELLILGGDDAHGDAWRERGRLRRRGQHHKRMRLDLKTRCGRGRRHLRRDLLDPFEGLGDDQLALPGADRADVGGGDRRPRAAPGLGVIGPARTGGNEQHERAVVLGSGPAPGESVAEGVNPLNDLVRTHSSTYLKGASRARPTVFTPRSVSGDPETRRRTGPRSPARKFGVQAGAAEWLAAHGDHPKAAEVRAQVDQHRSFWLRGYYGLLGQAYLTLVPVS